MRKFLIISGIVLGAALAAHAETLSVPEQINAARALLDSGDASGALEKYQNVLVDAPDSEAAKFGIACAQYMQAASASGVPGANATTDAFDTARKSFEELAAAQSPGLREDAAFNAANCAAQAAMLVMPAEMPAKDKKAYEAGVEALRGAVTAYERVLRDYPDNEKAQQNLDHVRYLLKLQLQNPPEEPPQSRMLSVISGASTQIPGAVVEVLPAPEEPGDAGGGGGAEPAPERPKGGNTAVLKPKTDKGQAP